ncbi:Uncharacterised protein [Staphylococcus epidermidis]|uniref:hypothetical protein n=1 Tax=Staphylococcus epidermidis TaxID=1282 RepID=UPI000DFD0BA0|nr:hypothetical protein [Staphylococcus epidermidis]SUM53568.1 Uncharacterised protein [Staphylococcus epidermidis]
MITTTLAIITLIVSIKTSNRNFLDSMDSKSEYRKTLFEKSAKKIVNGEDYLFLRSTMRYKPKTDNLTIPFIEDRNTFKNEKDKSLDPLDYMTALIIKFCESKNRLIELKYKNGDIEKLICISKNDENFRILCRYVLKHHWETNNTSFSSKYKDEDKYKLMNDTINLLEKFSLDKSVNKSVFCYLY